MTITRNILAIALFASLAACAGNTDDPVDDTGPTDDTGTTETGEETGDTAVASYCGDGVVDEGEACDDGDANGPTGSCSTECDWNGWVSCDDVTGTHALDVVNAQPDGAYHIADRFETLTALATSCAGDPTHNAVVTFTLPSDGTWRVTTDNPQTTVPTALSLRTDCDERAELSCDVGGTANGNAAQAYIIDGLAGDAYVAVVEQVGTEVGNWHLSLDPITDIAGEGDACSDTVPCDSGTICADEVCTVIEAPVITSSSISQSDTYDYSITITGTDKNHDANTVIVPAFTDIYTEVWGDSADEPAITIEDVHWQWSGDTFTAVIPVPVSFYDTGMGDNVTVDVLIADASGLESSTVTLTYPEAATNTTQDYVGDACDMCVDCSGNTNGFPRSCNPNSHADPNDSTVQLPGMECTWTDRNATSATCEDRNVNDPVEVESIGMHWEGEVSMLDLSVFDFRHYQGSTAHIVAVTANAESIDLGSKYISFASWNGGHQMGSAAFDASEITDTIDYLEIQVEDRGNPTATTETATVVDWVDYVAPTEVAAGEECDLLGWDTVCEEPTVCSPTLSGVPGCLTSEAPELLAISGVYQGGFFENITLSFEAFDTNADWSHLALTHYQGPVWEMDTSSWSADPFGKQVFESDVFVNFGTWLWKAKLVDADGNESAETIVLGVPTAAQGDACNTGVCGFRGCSAPETYCDVGAGDTCGLGADAPVCEVNEAPVLSTAVARRIDASKYEIDFSGTDANGDAFRVTLEQDEDGTVTHPNGQLDFDLPIEGSTNFVSTVKGTLDNPYATTTVTLAIADYGFAESNTLTVTIPPIRDAGDSCSGDDTVDQCVAGSECIDGSCFAYEPQLTDATIAWSADGRDAIVTITGLDDKVGDSMELRKAYVTIAGQTVEKSMNKYNTDWTGNTFTFDIDVKGIGTGTLIGERFMDVTIEDLGGFTDSGVYFITPHVGYGDTCDDAGVTDSCHAGLACDTSVCINDAVDACAGVPNMVATGDSVDYEFLTSGNGLDTYADYASCGGNNNPNGKEQVVVYTATQDGTLTITSTSTDGGAHPGYLFVRMSECVNADAVVACSNNIPNGSTIGPNSVDVTVATGDVLYVQIDGPTWKKGTGNLAFSYQ
ncbi:MAG: hypothetical protein KC912_22455 [Proteobacteria bacterium]|nr:hypothetical protein [Pseudomonadota bacterium]